LKLGQKGSRVPPPCPRVFSPQKKKTLCVNGGGGGGVGPGAGLDDFRRD